MIIFKLKSCYVSMQSLKSLLGLKSAGAIRAHLKAAIDDKSKSQLEKAIIECEEAGYPELSLDLRLARDTLERMGLGRGGQCVGRSLFIPFLLL